MQRCTPTHAMQPSLPNSNTDRRWQRGSTQHAGVCDDARQHNTRASADKMASNTTARRSTTHSAARNTHTLSRTNALRDRRSDLLN
uniref:Uncharacterized protein n=1 Tax=Trichogramma kaykai TaxID=54128 RepID=A0ABD2W775_9HYME